MAELQQLQSGQSVAGQLRNFANRLTRTQKIFIGGAVVAASAAVVMIIGMANKTQMSVLFSELEAKDAATIADKLRERNIPYELSNNGSTILIPQEVLHDTRLSLASEGLPESSVVGYELFDKTNLGMSDFVQKLNYRRALEGELARTIGSIGEVKKARVHIVIPEKALFDKDQKQATASVVLQLKGTKSINKLNVEGIQNLVASSIEGLDAGAVTVVDQKGQILSEPQRDKNSLAAMSDTQYELQQKVDQYLTSKVQSLLDGVLGVGNAVVRATTELDFQQIEKTEEKFNPDEQVVRSEQQLEGRSAAVDSLNYPATNSNSENRNKITNYEISKTVEKIINNGGGIKRMTVAALINGTTKVVEKDGAPTLEYTPRPQEQMLQLNQIIKNSVGYNPTRSDQVTVENIQFDITSEQEELERLRGTDLPLTTEEIIEKVLIVLAMLLAIWMIRKLIMSPQVRSRIEWVLGEPPAVDAALLATIRGDDPLLLLPGSNVASSSVSRLEPYDPNAERENLAELARRRLDEQTLGELTEDDFMKEEIGNRVKNYLLEKPADASRLLKLVMQQDYMKK
jgi:flagellar M-ring protein FliF